MFTKRSRVGWGDRIVGGIFRPGYKLGNIVAETLSLVMFPGIAKLAGNKQNFLLPWLLDKETLFWETKGHLSAL